MKRRPDQGAEPLPPPPEQRDAPAPPGSTAVQWLLARTLRAIADEQGDVVIKDAAEQLERTVRAPHV
jgi:hypothetical protein